MEQTPMPITRRKRANPPEQPENNNHNAEATENVGETPVNALPVNNEEAKPDAQLPENSERLAQPSSPAETQATISTPSSAPSRITNGERPERPEHVTPIESGRRTARGELFRRPPQLPAPQIVNATPVPPMQQPTHEISLPLGNLLHLAYNPGYTGAEDARSQLLQKLAQESKDGGRARCWNCGSLAIKYDRWNTRSKTFGEVGVAFCEVCNVWSVM